MGHATDAEVARSRRRPRLHAPAIVLFLSFVDVFALLPTVAPHVEGLGAGPIGVGVTVAAYSAANLPANVIGGILIDRLGRRPILIVGLVLAASAVAAYPLATTVHAVVVARLLHGVAGGILTPAVFAVAGDRVRRGEAGRAFGRLGAVIGLAAVVAPAAAGVIRQAAGTDAVFLVVAAALLLGALITIGWIRDVAGAPSRSGVPQTPTSSGRIAAEPARETVGPAGAPGGVGRQERLSIRPLLTSGPLRRGLMATVSLTAAVGVLAGFLPGAAEAAGASASMVGALFTTYAVVAGAIMLSPLSGRIDRSATSRVAASGLAVLSGSLVWLALATQVWQFGIGAALFGAGYGLVFPAVAGATSQTADLRSRGRAFGLFNAAFSLGIAAGPPLVGLLVEHLPGVGPFAPTAALTGIVALLLAIRPRH